MVIKLNFRNFSHTLLKKPLREKKCNEIYEPHIFSSRRSRSRAPKNAYRLYGFIIAKTKDSPNIHGMHTFGGASSRL